MKVINNFKNSLLKRKELKVAVESESNPSFPSSTKRIAEEFGASEDLIVIKGIRGQFGRKNFLIDAMIYDSVADKERIEPKKKEKVKVEGAK
jgi:ribosomal protein S24E